MPRLDPHGALVVDTRPLGRRPGAMRPVHRVVPAPPLELALLHVPADATLELDLRLEAVVEGVLVSGEARVTLVGECARCLGPVATSVAAPVQELYTYEPTDGEQPVIADELIDLEPTIRDAVLLSLPLSPLCRDDCPGLCATCGARLDEVPDDHSHAVTDERWAALRSLLPREGI
jgi:uncharacterized protein